MKILSIALDCVTLDDGSIRTLNELLWNYRSACCKYPLEIRDNAVYCSLCGKESVRVVHKSMVVTAELSTVEAIDALPENVRVVAVGGYRASMRRPYSYVIIHDGGGEQYELPESLRRV